MNFNSFDDLFNKKYNYVNTSSFSGDDWVEKKFKSPDGKITFTYFSRTNKFEPTLDEIGQLKSELETAVESQDFEQAVVLRDRIKNLEKNKQQILDLESKLKECVKSQDFEKAIEYRDQINKLKS